MELQSHSYYPKKALEKKTENFCKMWFIFLSIKYKIIVNLFKKYDKNVFRVKTVSSK